MAIPILLLSLFAIVYFIAYRKEWKRNKDGVKNALSYIRYLAGGLGLILIFNIVGNLLLNEEKFGHEFNSARQKMGMMPIPADWISTYKVLNSWKDYLSSGNSSYTKWYSSKSEGKNAVFTSKVIGVDDGVITFETDHFMKDSVSISISHFYQDSTFKYSLDRDNHLDDTVKKTVLDSLRKWKVK
jgi:hypothetical protein